MTLFEDLPNEFILKIFSYLDIKDLCQCLAVNKRIRAIASDESLWEKVHISAEIPASILKKIVDKGCKYLSLFNSIVIKDDVTFEKNFKLKYLNLDTIAEGTEENFDILPNLAASCHSLEKLFLYRKNDPLEMRFNKLHPKVFKCIIQNR